MKVYVYILSSKGDTLINGSKYDLVGIVKNNEEINFEINEENKIIHICYWKSLNFYPAIYNVKEGLNNIEINIKPKLSPFKGNPIKITKVVEM